MNVFVIGNDFDPDGDAFSVVRPPPPPTAAWSTSGTGFHYTPNAGFSGIETITYRLRDTHGLTSNGLAAVLVNAVRQSAHRRFGELHGAGRRHLLRSPLSAVDPEGQPLTWTFVTTPAGQLTGSLTWRGADVDLHGAEQHR